jgi:hypothetical protein
VQSVIDIPEVGAALLDVTAVFKDLSRQKKLTRKSGLGSDIYLYCKEVELLVGRSRVIASRVHQLQRGIAEKQGAPSVFDLLVEQCVRTRAFLHNLQNEPGPYAQVLGEDELEVVREALKLPWLQVTDAPAARHLVLAVEKGERTIKAPEDIAERLAEDKEGAQNIREIEQAVASLKSRLGKEFDPGARTDTRRAK